MRKRFLIHISIGFVLALAVIALAVDDPFTGTWKMNPEKSKVSDNFNAYETKFSIEARENRIITTNSMTVQGTPSPEEGEMILDGKDYPITLPALDLSLIRTATRIDTHTIEIVLKAQAGNTVRTNRSVVSKDGNTLTRTVQTFRPMRNQTSIIVYDKQ